MVASITPSVKRLRGFKKIELNGKEVATIKLSVPVKDLAFVGKQNKWVVEAGEFSLNISNLQTKFTVVEPK
jgi:beta-glucosidase